MWCDEHKDSVIVDIWILKICFILVTNHINQLTLL